MSSFRVHGAWYLPSKTCVRPGGGGEQLSSQAPPLSPQHNLLANSASCQAAHPAPASLLARHTWKKLKCLAPLWVLRDAVCSYGITGILSVTGGIS